MVFRPSLKVLALSRMTLLLVFSITLLLAVLISGLAARSVLSVSVLFLAAGFLVGIGAFGKIGGASPQLLERMAEIALFAVLFTDGMRTGGLHEIRDHWRFPGRALLIGMPLTIGGIALLAHYLVGIRWPSAFLLGAATSPTDPVFVSAIFRFEAVPDRLKRLLNIESGLNDGMALPAVIVLLNLLGGGSSKATWVVLGDLALGAAIGVVIPAIGLWLERSRIFGAVGIYQPLNAFALGLLVLAVSYTTGANLFLAAFTAGVTIATVSQSARESFESFGELIAELLKLGALLIFAVLITPRLFMPLPGLEYVFILLAVFAVRLVAVPASLLASGLPTEECLAAGWFGPKGFASVVYGLLILQRGLAHVAHLVALMVFASIVVYSSTDILIGRWFGRRARSQAGLRAA